MFLSDSRGQEKLTFNFSLNCIRKLSVLPLEQIADMIDMHRNAEIKTLFIILIY